MLDCGAPAPANQHATLRSPAAPRRASGGAKGAPGAATAATLLASMMQLDVARCPETRAARPAPAGRRSERSGAAKTVEAHVSAVLRELQLSNRDELSRWAAERRPD